MTRTKIGAALAALVPVLLPSAGSAQHGKDIRLHVNPKWSECAFHLDPSLTQAAWRQFTGEAGLVAYFRPVTDARPMGAGNFELSLMQWRTSIDDADPAWNDTFVHPDSTHWLHDGGGLPFPGLMLRAGVTDRIDAGAYFTRNPESNYGFFGGQVQFNVVNDTTADWAASARLSFVTLFGPEDLDLAVYGVDLLASKEMFASRWVSVSPYAGVSAYLSRSHETADAVDLEDENILGARAMVGAVVQLSAARLALEYSTARVNSRSIKVGFAF
jgi:hypothetical protein